MKTQSTYQLSGKSFLPALLFFISLNGFSQTMANDNNRVTTLQNVVEEIKANNETIKNAEHVNVMVNDLLILDLEDFKIDPKSIAAVEVLDLNPRAGSGERIKSIIINTKKNK